MYIMFSDETSLVTPLHARVQDTNSFPPKFFFYGGLILEADKLALLHEGIQGIRNKYGYQDDDKLKSALRECPKHIPKKSFYEAKDEVLDLCHFLECKFICTATPHGMIHAQDNRKYIEWTASSVFARFNRFLQERDDFGICFADTLPSQMGADYLKRLFM